MCFVLFPFVYYVLSGRKLGVNMDSFIVIDTKLHPTSSALVYACDCEDGLDSVSSDVDPAVGYETLIS